MSEGEDSFEERIRSFAREFTRSVERLADLDLNEMAETLGVDPERVQELADSAGRWFSAHAHASPDVNFGEPGFPDAEAAPGPWSAGAARSGGGPHPLDVPTEDQGLALSALDSGRWTVEPGSDVLVAHGEGPPPDHVLGVAGELRARDWIDASGQVTLVGHNALSRWLEAGKTA